MHWIQDRGWAAAGTASARAKALLIIKRRIMDACLSSVEFRLETRRGLVADRCIGPIERRPSAPARELKTEHRVLGGYLT